MITIKSYHGLVSQVIIERYKQERKQTRGLEKEIAACLETINPKINRKNFLYDLKKLAFTFLNQDADNYQRQKLINAAYRVALDYFRNEKGGNLDR